MSQWSYWIPHPRLSFVLLAIWILLVNSFTPGQIILGGVLGLTIPWLSNKFWPQRLCFQKPVRALRFLAIVLWDIVIANFVVARWVLGSTNKLKPTFITLPLTIRDDFAISVLAGTISLTPGTVSVEVDKESYTLLIHCLNVEDEDTLKEHIKTRYELPIREILECSTL